MNEARTSVENFDLRRHAVVEASAGTGKTYTIERLVLRLLTEEPIPIEQILVVTFTEKATGELKTRLRKMLERELTNDAAAPLVRTALDRFDQAPIFTIHGFCQRLTQEYALEQGQDFRPELTNDFDLMRTLLREVQRKHWRTRFGARLKAVLEKAGYHRDSADDWERKVLDIAIRYKPRCGHQLLPAPVPDWWQRLDEADANWNGQLEIFTIDTLHRLMRDHKKQRGLQSFDDMIATVEESLDPERNRDAESLLNLLRARYRCGIVDEFQDTDPLQWRIFRRIFLEGGASKLFIVGDPKQAIYGFRGSDLPTYLHAAKEMKSQHGACEHALDENWRSLQDLLDALNCLFGDGDWFPRESGIHYHAVHAPDADRTNLHVEQDDTGRAAMTIVDVTRWERLKLAHKQYARFIAQEIRRLLSGGTLTFSHKGKPARPLHAGDIGVLVAKRAEAEPLTQALDGLGIPYSFYKQTGLWQSDEATHVDVLLQTLARPDDRPAFRKALLTCFFRVRPEELARTPDVPSHHPARQLYQTWLGYAENRQWSALCRSLLEDTGLMFVDGRQRVEVLEQLLAAVEQTGHGRNLDLLGLLDWLGDLRSQRETGDADLVPMEAERAKVQIMTIHAAKGLEFPVVFLAGGFTQGSGVVGPAVYRDDVGRVVYDLNPDEDAKARVKSEQLAEQRRALYVALTRPMLKLYVPKVKVTSRSRQFAGPVGTILLPALEQSCPEKLAPLIADVIVPPLFAGPAAPSLSTPAPIATTAEPIAISGPLFAALDSQISKRRIVVRSFSSMARHHLMQVGEGASFGEQAPSPEDEAAAPADQEDPLRGPVFGDMVHKVLEAIDFAEVVRAAEPSDLWRAGARARQCLDKVVREDSAQLHTRTPIDQLEEAARRQIAQLVWQALTTPLDAIGCRIGEVPKNDRLHEIEFLFPERADANQRREEGFVTGFMDLLFRRDERYYLLDWKTNLLPGYAREHLQRSMADSDYHRQYRLYLHAIERWLRRMHGKVFDFEKCFGGVYYLYLRGMNGRDETTGVYFHAPTKKDLVLEPM